MKWLRASYQFAFAAALVLVISGIVHLHAETDSRPNQPRAGQDAQALFKAMRAPGDSTRIDALFSQLRKTDSIEASQSIADEIWQIWLRSGSDTVDLLVNRAEVLMRERQYDDAIELLDTVVEIAPRFAEGWNKRATAYFLKGEYNQSIIDVRQVLALEPRHFGALSGLGTMMREIGDPASALSAYRAALKVYPQLPGAKRAVEELTDEVEGREI